MSLDTGESDAAEPRPRPWCAYRAPIRRAIAALEERAQIRLRRRGLPTDGGLDLHAAAELRELADRLPDESSDRKRNPRYLLGRNAAVKDPPLPPIPGRTGAET